MSHNNPRALYGPSIPVQFKLEKVLENLPKILFHGTQENHKNSILKIGLQPGKRQYVHLSGSIATAHVVAKRRKGRSIYFKVITADLYMAGFRFRSVGKDTILSNAIPSNFLSLM